MRKLAVYHIVVAGILMLSGCDQEVMMSERGFRLPDGDPQAGADAFLYMQCNQCHTIKGVELPVIPMADPPYVELGGDVTKVRTYGELVTSIINPSHDLAEGYAEEVVSEDGESNMYNYNGYMTVQELADIVRYLQPFYKVTVPAVQMVPYP